MKSLIHRGLVYMLAVLFVAAAVLPQATKVEAAKPPLDLEAPSAILVDAETGKVLFAKKADVPRSPASMTKMMAEYLILDAIKQGKIDWNSKVRINDYMYKLSQDNSLSGIPLLKSLTYSVKELYKAMAVYSSNAATIALGAKIYGNEEKFVEAMNQKAKEFGMTDTKFVNSTGLNNSDLYGHIAKGGPNEENQMSARDVATLAYHLLKDHPEVLEYTKMPSAMFKKGLNQPQKMRNWNELVIPESPFYYEGADGLKTGHTSEAGYCLTATAERDGMRLISVVMKTASEPARFRQSAKLLDYGFSNFRKVTLLENGYTPKNKKELPVTKGKTDSVSIETSKPIKLVIQEGTKKKYKPELTIDQSLLTKKGKKVGTVKMVYTGGKPYDYLTKNGGELASVSVVTTESVDKASWFTLTMRGIGDFFSGLWTSLTDMVTGWF
ncbi:MAG TPA: D-alanyl-D-alanine carboxypeptidase family protein [Bacillales bacterium]